jgi:hypothetical protein
MALRTEWQENKRKFEEEMAEMETAHQNKMRQILRDKLVTLEDHLAGFVDPTNGNATSTIYNIETTKLQLEMPSIRIDLTPDERLFVLDRTELWYTSRGYEYPFPERIKEQREYWQRRKAESDK